MSQDGSVWSLPENSQQHWLHVWRQKGGVVVLVAYTTYAQDAGVGEHRLAAAYLEGRSHAVACLSGSVALAVGEEEGVLGLGRG